jgi:histidine ammonia-lyase
MFPSPCGRLALAALSCLGAALAAEAEPAYTPITPDRAGETITLTGHDLTLDQLIAIARHGAKVALSPEARQRSADAYGLLLEGSAEGVPIYWFNRGSGDNRETVIFNGDPTAPENREMLLKSQREIFEAGARAGYGPEVSKEEITRAMLAVRVNTITYEAASPALTQRLLDLLNDRITPVVQSRGSVGEGDLAPFDNVEATMVGKGDAWYQGTRMPAAKALAAAGLAPLAPFAADDAAFSSSNGYGVGQAALVVADAAAALDWADLILAMDLDGMNSSITPLSTPVQANRAFKWLNFDAARVLDMLRGSYLFDSDPARIIQDPESLRASSSRQGAAWQAWAALRDDLLVQINSSDHNPAIRVGAAPADSWELATPQFMRYYVKGGPLSHGQHGYILSNANWDPYPLATDIEAFTIALANMDIAVAQRIERFANPFFTKIKPGDLLDAEQLARSPFQDDDYIPTDLSQEIGTLAEPVTPAGNALLSTVEDLQAETRLKTQHARDAVDLTLHLLAQDLLVACDWMDLRHLQDSKRGFGAAPTAAWTAFRRVVPWQSDPATRPPVSLAGLAYGFLTDTPASRFYPSGAP